LFNFKTKYKTFRQESVTPDTVGSLLSIRKYRKRLYLVNAFMQIFA
jgi:hypothetical protein